MCLRSREQPRDVDEVQRQVLQAVRVRVRGGAGRGEPASHVGHDGRIVVDEVIERTPACVLDRYIDGPSRSIHGHKRAEAAHEELHRARPYGELDQRTHLQHSQRSR